MSSNTTTTTGDLLVEATLLINHIEPSPFNFPLQWTTTGPISFVNPDSKGETN